MAGCWRPNWIKFACLDFSGQACGVTLHSKSQCAAPDRDPMATREFPLGDS
jgi:hypothetical protein